MVMNDEAFLGGYPRVEKKIRVTVCHWKVPTSVRSPDMHCAVNSAEVSRQVEVNATDSTCVIMRLSEGGTNCQVIGETEKSNEDIRL